ncbi:MAG: hypothetical protein JEZ00_07590 [Anaerolineaceae bacterium]|nr:hypothetical protein [Anaerolineaceae bacterium]
MSEKKEKNVNKTTQSLSVEEMAAVATHLYQAEKKHSSSQPAVNQQMISAWQTAAWLGQLRGGC